jgi:hypothetical protein
MPEIEATPTGSCSWEWKVPEDASASDAEFRVAATKPNDFRMLVPVIFSIEK